MIEHLVISAVLKYKEVNALFDKKIKVDYFDDEVCRKSFSFIMDFYRKYQGLPTMETVKQTCGFQVKDVKEPMDFYLDKLMQKKLHNGLVYTMQSIQELMQTDDSERNALKVLSDFVSRCYMESAYKDSEWVGNVQSRMDKYQELKKGAGVYGIPLPWKQVSDEILGLQKEQLVTVVGRPATGKTWFAIITAFAAMRHKFVPLIISKEMSIQEIERRLDALYLKAPYRTLRTGDFDIKELKSLKAKFRKCYITAEDVDVEGRIGISFVQAKILQYRPDLVICDAVNLFEDERNGYSKTERLYHITQDMKRLARTFRLPVIQTAQMGRGAADQGDLGGGLDNIQWSDSFAQDSDVILELVRTPKMVVSGKALLKLLKQREGPKDMKWALNWNFETMEFSVREEGEDEPECEEDSTLNPVFY